ncbi:nucleotidyltransferase domain-containing protein [Streptomyces sp. NA04227]|uniref:nucleotidyltransferase domain-containing protein n=1 Tax=Streptomyces sp. NA04227 TaxID=2742136 RepID=UPI001590DD73|nr:nucleotidyltransferase domain-containing protein [Streptomyces sp. NA04227]QKW05839.1 nucleotidyltransferase domain-containing protein [Streptomyces sp. NA04227]
MPDERTSALLDHFVTALRTELAPTAVWAHGSLAGGDYQEGRSDLDLIAVLDGADSRATRRRLERLHQDLRAEHPLADHLHCGYLDPDHLDDSARSHTIWAYNELFERPVSPVTRRELHAFGRVFLGAGPVDVLPPVTTRELNTYVVGDQRDYWRPRLDTDKLWQQDLWVDLGLLTHARARVTLEEGRLITKYEALDALLSAGAPEELVVDVRARRYGQSVRRDEDWQRERAELTRDFLASAIDALVARYG